MQKRVTIKPKMKRKQVSLGCAILLLIATLPSHSTSPLAIDVKSAELDLQNAPTGKSLFATKHMLATWLKSRKHVAFKNVHKVPSGPHGKSANTTIDPAMNERPTGDTCHVNHAKQAEVKMAPLHFWDSTSRMSFWS